MYANPPYILNTSLLQIFLNDPQDEAYNECPGNAKEM